MSYVLHYLPYKCVFRFLQRKYQHLPELHQDFERIQEDVSRSTKILENLLLLARLEPNEAEQPELPKTVIDLNYLLARVIETVDFRRES